MRRVLELHLPPEIYGAVLDALPKLKRIALKLEPREHFVLENNKELLLLAVSSDRVTVEEMKRTK